MIARTVRVALVALLVVAVLAVGSALPAATPAGAQGSTTTTIRSAGPPRGDDGELSDGEIVAIVIGGLVAVAIGLAGATWWYVRATRPIPPPPGPEHRGHRPDR